MKKIGIQTVKKENEITLLKKKIKILEKEISTLNENILDSTSINEQAIKLIENLTTEILYLKQKSKINDQNSKSIFRWIEKQNWFVNYSVEKMKKINKSLSELERIKKSGFSQLDFDISMSNFKNTIRALTENDEKTAKSISEINKTLGMLSQNDNKIAEALFEISKKIEETSPDFDSIYGLEKFNDTKTFVIVKKNYIIFSIQKSLKRFAYEAIVGYINSNVSIKNIYFYFKLADPTESKKEYNRFIKYYLKRIYKKYVDVMYD